MYQGKYIVPRGVSQNFLYIVTKYFVKKNLLVPRAIFIVQFPQKLFF